MSNSPTDNEFDIILVLQDHRHTMLYICLLNTLSSKLRIGLYLIPMLERKEKNTRISRRRFIDLCWKKGALATKRSSKTQLLIMPSRITDFSLINKDVSYKRVACLATLEEPFDSLKKVFEFGVKDLFVLNTKRFIMGRSQVESEFIKKRFRLHSIGIPEKKYPVFKIPPIDYLISIPTHVAMPSAEDRLGFCKNVLSLTSKTESGDSIVIKTHPVRDIGNTLFYIKEVERIRKLPSWKRFLRRMKIWCKFLLPKDYQEKFIGTECMNINAEIADRSKYLSEISKYSFLGLEYFLNSVRKGLITGHSAGIYHALAQQVPVFNCSPPLSNDVHVQIKRNYKWLGVQPCHGDLKFDKNLYDNIELEERESDIIETIETMARAGKVTKSP